MRDHRTSIPQATVGIETSGFVDGPAHVLRDYLLREGVADLLMVQHPLGAEEHGGHLISRWHDGALAERRRVRLPNAPPWTYPLDMLVRTPRQATDVWFGFNVLAVARGLIGRRRGHVTRVVHWCVDFVPNRFGTGMTTRAYDALDSYACTHATARFELSTAARDGRNQRHGLRPPDIAPVHIVPMGAWLDRVPQCREQLGSRWHLVYMGHLVERQGVGTLLQAVAQLVQRGRPVHLDVIGRGPLRERLEALAHDLGIASSVTFHGLVPRHEDVERLLAAGTAGCAPYVESDDSFTQYADPGKLKAYLGAGLPIVTTRVAPNANALARDAGALVTSHSPDALAAAIEEIHADAGLWAARRRDAIAYAQQFDWPRILRAPLADVGLVSDT